MKATKGEKIFYAINYTFLSIVGLSCLLPLMHVMATSLSSYQAIISGRVTFFPVDISFDSYRLMLKGTPIINSFKNSVVLTVVGVLLSMTATILAAYPLSKKYLYARKQLTMLMVFTMLFGGGLIPSYLVVKALGLVDSYWSLWLGGLVGTYNMLVLRTFFVNIPSELEDAAHVDGCGELRMLIRIFLPLSVPCLATLTLFYAVGRWNEFRSVLIYINSTKKFNLAVMVNNMIRSQSLLNKDYMQAEDIAQMTPQGVQTAGVMVMIIPIICVYPFVQRHFVKGVMLGSIKG